MNESLYNGQTVIFSVSISQRLYDKMEEVRAQEPFKISRAAFVAGLIEKGLQEHEENSKNSDTDE